MLEHAELAASDERYGEAASRLRELLALFEAGTDALPLVREQAAYRLGVCAFRQEQFEDAAGLFVTFLDAFPASPLVPSACLLGGESMYHVGRHQQATALLARVPNDHPDDEACGPSLLRLGECLALLESWDRSEDTYAAYIDRFPDSGQWFQAQFGVGWARENRGRLDEAVEAYRVLVDRHEGPTAARAQFQIGECFFAQKRYEDAVRNLLKVDILYGYPEWSAAALYEAGRCFQEMHDPVQARQQFERVRERHGDTEWALLATKRLADLEKVSLPGRSSS